MGTEIWKDIPNYEGLYQINNLGIIKSFSRKNSIILKQSFNKTYLKVSLRKEGISKTWMVHKLMAITFLNHAPDIDNLIVDHINNNPIDNRLENLQLITYRLNNSKDKKNKTSLYTGSYWSKTKNKWVASITQNNKKIYLGCFDTEKEAKDAYESALKNLSFDIDNIYKADFSSKYKFISYYQKIKRWVVKINGRHLGCFKTEEDCIKFIKNNNYELKER